jgi:outer membrane lipoprotein-sorting protein
MRHLLRTLVVLALAVTPAWADEAEDPTFRSALHDRIQATLDSTKSLTWYQDIWATNGKKDDNTSADCFWVAPDKVRLNVKKGRGAGATALYANGKVTGFKPGMFSFVKLSYDVRDPEVMGVRGSDIRSNGFLDDWGLILSQWAAVKIARAGEKLVLQYKSAEGLPAKMWVAESSLQPSKIETEENGKVVERFEYKNVVYNAAIDPKLFNP